MRIERIHLKRYGHFGELPVEIGAGAPLALVVGPNGAGKTTILQALRDLLFGVPARTEYAFAFGYQALRIEGRLRAADGTALEVARRKGRSRTVEGRRIGDGGDAPLDDAGFKRALGAMTRERYEALFAVGLDELRQGAKLLESVGLGELLAGGALGGAGDRVLALRKSLGTELDRGFRPQAQKPRINALLSELEGARKDAERAELSRNQYDKERRARDEAVRVHERLVDKVRELAMRREALDAQVRAWPDVQDLLRLDAALAEPRLDVPLAAERAEESAKALDSAAELATQRDRVVREVERERARAQSARVDEALLAEGPAVDALVRRVADIRRKRQELPREQEETRVERERIGAEARRVRPDLGPGALAESLPSAAAREEIAALAEEDRQSREELRRVRERLRDRHRELEEAQVLLDELKEADDAEALIVLEQRVEAARTDHEKLRELELKVAEAEADIQARAEAIRPPWPAGVDVAGAPLPPRARVDELLAEAESIERELRERQSELQRLDRERGDEERALEALLSRREPPRSRDLQSARERREERWRSIRKAWLGGGAVAEPEASADGFERCVADADAVADEMREASQVVAERSQREARIEALASSRAEVRDSVEGSTRRRQAWAERWKSLWDELGVEVDGPNVMKEWLREAEALRERGQERLRDDRRAEALRSAVAPVASALREALRAGADESWDALVGRLRKRLEEIRNQAARREQAAKRLRTAERAAEAEERLAEELEGAIETSRRRAVSLVRALGFHDEPDPPQLLERVERLEGLDREARKLVAREAELERTAAEIRRFDREVEQILERTGRSAEGRAYEVVVDRLANALQQVRSAEQLRHEASQRARERAEELEQIEAEQRGLADALGRLRQLAGAADDDELADVSRRSREREALRRQRADVDERLTRLLGAGDSHVAAVRELGEQSLEVLKARRDDVARELEDASRERDDMGQQLGSLKTILEGYGGGEAARLEAEAEALRAELDEAVEDWLLRAAAREILDRVVARYAEEHQAGLLQRASGIMSRMTEGAWQRVVRPLGTDELRVVGAHDDGGLTPDQLSTGTREQLFLALRLAWVLEYADQNEPLPVVLDDVLVNFDPARAKATLAALADVGRSCQVILLTCHPHQARWAAQATPEVRVAELGDRPGRAEPARTPSDAPGELV